MPKTNTKVTCEAPRDRADASALLERLGALVGDVTKTMAYAERRVREITAKAADDLAPAQAEIAAIRKALKKWADKRRPALVDPGTKTVTLSTGTLAWRDTPEALQLAEGWKEEAVIQQLLVAGFVECVRQPAPVLDKPQIKKLWAHLAEKEIAGLQLVAGEVFQLKPLSIAEPIEMKTRTENVVDELDGKPKKERSK